MRFTRHFLQTMLAMSTLTAMASVAHADQPYGYMGIGVGNSTYDWSSSQCAQYFQQASGNPNVDCTVSANQTGGKLFAGYSLNRNLGFEFGLYDFGQLSGTVTVPGSSLGPLPIQLKVTAVNLDVVGSVPLADSGVTLSAKAGFYSAGSQATDSLGDNTTNNNVGLDFGARVSFNFSRYVTGRLEYESFQNVGSNSGSNSNSSSNNPEMNLSLVSVGLVYNFR